MRHALLPIALLLLAAAASAAAPPRVRFSGNFRISEEDLIGSAERDVKLFVKANDEAAAEDAAFEMTRLYRGKGFPFASVEAVFVDTGVLFLVREGPKVYFAGAAVVGAPPDRAEKLASFASPPKEWFLGRRLFVRSPLESARSKMLSWLRQEGFLDAEVEGPFTPALDDLETREELTHLPREMSVAVRYEVKLGPRAWLDSVELDLSDPDDTDAVWPAAGRYLGKPYGPFIPFDLEASVRSLFAHRGHPFATCTVTEETVREEDRTSVRLLVSVESGPLCRLARIDIAGNTRVDDLAIRRQLEFAPGEVYDLKKVDLSRRNLALMSLFDESIVTLTPKADPEELKGLEEVEAELELKVGERDFRKVETSVGWGTWDLLRGSIAVTWLNLDGFGRSLTVGVDASTKGAGGRVSIAEPWVMSRLLGKRVRGTAEASLERRQRPTFRYTRAGIGVSVAKLLKRRGVDGYDLAPTLGYRFSDTDVFEVVEDLPPEFTNTTAVGELFFTLTYEARDNPWSPTNGTSARGTIEWADRIFVSELDFLRLRLSVTHLFDLGERTVFVVRGAAGAISPYGSTDEIPIQERFYVGGGSTVRSFGQDQLGPRLLNEDGTQSSSPSGGEFFTLFNLELRKTLAGALEGAAFIDGGNVIQDLNDASLDGYRFGVGAGLRYRTPLGPLRIDFAVNPNPKSYEDRWRFWFALGYPF